MQVKDVCYNEIVEKQVEVVVPLYKPLEFQLLDVVANEVNSFQDECPYVPKQLNIKASNGGGDYTYEWLDQGKLFSSKFSDYLVPSKSTVYTISVIDRCGVKISKLINYINKIFSLQLCNFNNCKARLKTFDYLLYVTT